MTPQEAIEAAELVELEERYRRQVGREMYQAGRRAAAEEAALRYEGLTREADDAVAALKDLRWGPGGRAHFGDPRPGDFPGRVPQQRQPEPEPELELEAG